MNFLQQCVPLSVVEFSGGVAVAVLTDNCKCNCTLAACEKRYKSFAAPPNTVRSLKHELAWLAVVESLEARAQHSYY